jgi:hypothetical protein
MTLFVNTISRKYIINSNTYLFISCRNCNFKGIFFVQDRKIQVICLPSDETDEPAQPSPNRQLIHGRFTISPTKWHLISHAHTNAMPCHASAHPSETCAACRCNPPANSPIRARRAATGAMEMVSCEWPRGQEGQYTLFLVDFRLVSDGNWSNQAGTRTIAGVYVKRGLYTP